MYYAIMYFESEQIELQYFDQDQSHEKMNPKDFINKNFINE